MTHRLLIPFLAALLLLGGCNQQKGATAASGEAQAAAGGPVALVNGESVSTELLDLYSRTRLGKAAADLRPEQKEELLDQLIGVKVAAQSAVKSGLDKNPDIAAQLELLRINALAEAQVNKQLGDYRPSETELRAEYETQVSQMSDLEYRARHILVATESFAESLIARIKNGAKFEDVARKESMDGTKENGGDLGWFSPTNMVPEFSAAVQALKKGQMTDKPVKTEFGYHIIRVEDTRPSTRPEYEQVKDRLTQIVRQKKIKAYVDELKKATTIEKKNT